MKTQILRCLCFSLLALASAMAAAVPRMPTGHFACHVVTVSGKEDVTWMQADSLERAKEMALELPIPVAIGEVEAVGSVVECIAWPGEFEAEAANKMMRSKDL
jgi:hypothetical protein